MNRTITVLPLDERPVSTSLPASIAGIAGVECVLPGGSLLPSIRSPGDLEVLAGWLELQRQGSSAAVVSLEGLGFGGLVPSRIGHERVGEILAKWAVLDAPGAPVSAFALVPRTPDSLDAMEEPEYWDRHGPALHRHSAALAVGAEIERAGADVPVEIRRDWIGRRLRQHTLALHAIGLVADGSISRLVIGVDDAAEHSLSAVNQRSLDEWIGWCELGDRASAQPGADEIAAVLVARACLDLLDAPAPRIGIRCAEPGALDRVAAYEPSPVGETAIRQVRAAGGVPVLDGSIEVDAILVIHPPEISTGRLIDWATAPGERPDSKLSQATVREFTRSLGDAPIVGIADVARPNGADPTLIAALDESAAWPRLSGFAAWNTAGNSIGTVVAQLVATVCARHAGTVDSGQSRLAIARRLVEDFGWMSVERARVRTELSLSADRHDLVAETEASIESLAAAERRLGALLSERPHFVGLSVRPGSLTLPWKRTFEIDMVIEKSP